MPPDGIMNKGLLWYDIIASLALVKLKKLRKRKHSSAGHTGNVKIHTIVQIDSAVLSIALIHPHQVPPTGTDQ